MAREQCHVLSLLGSGPPDPAGRSQLEWGATVPLQTDSLGGGAGMGRWVSHWGSSGSGVETNNWMKKWGTYTV